MIDENVKIAILDSLLKSDVMSQYILDLQDSIDRKPESHRSSKDAVHDRIAVLSDILTKMVYLIHRGL